MSVVDFPKQIRGATAVALAALVLVAAPVAGARSPVPAPAVEAELRAVAAHPRAPDAAARLLRAAASLDALSPAAQRSWLERLAAVKRAPEVAARATLLLGRYQPPSKARRAARELGFIDRWLATGPAPAPPGDALRPHADLMATPPPELGGRLTGLQRPLVWEALDGHGPPGAISVDHLLPDGEAAAAHLVTVVTSSEAREATLGLGGVGALAVSLNGELIGTVKSLSFSAADQVQATVRLAPGDNVLAITVVRDGRRSAEVYARFTDAAGRPLDGLTVTLPEAPAWPRLGPGDPDALRWVPRPAPEGAGVEARILAAVWRRALGLPDVVPGSKGGPAALLEDLLLTSEAAALPPSRILLTLPHLPREEARASVLLHMRANGPERPRSPELRLALADLAAQKGQGVRARLLAGASVAKPSELERFVRARIERWDHAPATAWRRLSAELEDPDTPERWLRESIRAAIDVERPDLALKIVARLAGDLPGDAEIAGVAAGLLSRLGRWDEAVDTLEALAASRPDLPGYRIEAARLALEAGRAKRARRILTGLDGALGVQTDALEMAGALREQLGDRERALVLYRRALEVRPTNPQLREAVERLDPSTRKPLPFTVEVTPELLATPTVSPDAFFETLVEEVHVDIQPDGGTTRHQRRIVRVLKVPEDREARTSVVRYDPSQEQVRVVSARVHRDGLAIPVLERESAQVSEAWYGLYYDQRELGVPFDDLRPGDVIEVTHQSESVGTRALPGTFDMLELLQERSYKHRHLVTVTAPPGMALRTRVSAPDRVRSAGARLTERREVLPDGRQRVRLEARNLPGLPVERAMPGTAEVAAIWQVTTFGSWHDLASGYAALIDPQRVVTPAMARWVEAKKDAATSAEGVLSRKSLTRALVEGITREIRYVGLEFGVHGYKPYRTDQVWVRRFGDCKDQATLLTTLLGLAGIDARVVLVRTRQQGRVPQALPSLALFDHAIVYLPDDDLFVDPTARTHGLGELPAGDQGAQVVVLDPAQGDLALRVTPSNVPARSGIEGFYTVMLHPTGRAGIRGSVTFRGNQAPTYRARLEDEDARESRLEKLLNGRYPGLQLTGYTVSDPSNLARPLELTFSGQAPQVAARIGGSLQVARPTGGNGLAQRWAGDSHRVHPVVLGPPAEHRFRFKYIGPVGWTPRELPPERSRKSRFGAYDVRWRQEPGAVIVETLLKLEVDQVAPEDYTAFRDFMQSFDEAVRPPLVLTPGGGGSGNAASAPEGRAP